MRLWSMPSSGNSYKVRLLLAKLGRAFEHVDAEEGSGVTTSDAFRSLNPRGKVPLLRLDDGRLLTESNAILAYLAAGTRFLPDDPFDRARTLAWMFWEQNAHEPVIAVRAGILAYEKNARRRTPAILDPLLDQGHAVLAVMEEHLSGEADEAGAAWFTPGGFGIADIALYAYTHSAGPKGGYEMDRFPRIGEWLARCERDAGHVPLDWLPG